MRLSISPRRVLVAVFAIVAIGAAVCVSYFGYFQPRRTLEFSALVAAAVLTCASAVQRSSARQWTTVPPSFVIEMTALLLLGPAAMAIIAICAALMLVLAEKGHGSLRRTIINLIAVAASTSAAAWVYSALSAPIAAFVWPHQGIPIAAVIATYCVTKSVVVEIAAPLVTRRPINRAWATTLALGAPNYFVAAGLGIGLTAMILYRAVELVPIAVLPLVFVYRAYADHVARLEEDRCRQEVIDSVNHGMTVLDGHGIVTLWDAGAARLLDCAASDALGKTIGDAVPALAKTTLPKAIDEVLAAGSEKLLEHIKAGDRTFHVRIVPVANGATLLWTGTTAQVKVYRDAKRAVERLTLAAEGANDGLWEWDLRNGEFYSSSRWRAMVGLPATDGVGTVSDWFGRVHNDDRAELKLKLEAHLSGSTERFEHTHRLRHEDGTYRKFRCRSTASRGTGTRQVRIAGSLTDITATGEFVPSAGALDPLTGVANRAMFVELLGRRLDDGRQGRIVKPFAVLYVDLDRFKIVNDNLGHLVGDELLTAVSRRLETCLRKGDILARLGGDEFAILLSELGDANQANAIAFRLQESLKAAVSIGGREVFTSASIGIACGPGQYNTPDEILRDADIAMYHAKSHGKARHEMFDADMHARELDRVGLENDLRHAVNNNAFELHYQPIVLLESGKCVGFESLARWSRNGEPVSPAVFIPLAEELGIIDQLGNWALRQACTTFADWKRRYPDAGLDYITVNVSSRQLMQQNFLWIVERAVEESGLQPRDLRLEITETALMDNPGEAAKLLSALREFGAKIYLDDFGCGYSSLSHLAKLPVDALKIDRSFVKNLTMTDRPAIVESILALARTLHTGVVAEGIEQEAQGDELRRLGCTHAQGYLFSRPVSAKQCEDIVAAGKPLGPVRDASKPAPAAPASEFDFGSAAFQWPAELIERRPS